MVRFAYVAAAIAIVVAAPASAQDWRLTAISGEKPDRTVYLIDATSIVRDGDNVTFVTQSIFEHVTTTRDFDRSVTKRSGICSTMTSQIVENSYYVHGSFQSTDSQKGNVITHKPGTVMYDTLGMACGIKQIDPGTIADPEAQVRNYFAK